jgi:glycosyltransferase involved in cell wall biosynthesis
LGKLAADFDISCGDSPFNARELEMRGFRDPTVLPIAIDPQKWSGNPDPKLMDELQDGRTNIIFVGRIAPNKKQDDLITSFNHYLDLDPAARLILLGKAEQGDAYANYLLDLIASLKLEDAVTFTGNIDNAQLAAYYRTAHLFWSMSEHEGFCVPLVEAMWFDVPVLAYNSSAVPETLAAAGILFNDKSQPRQLAALAHVLVTDLALRRKIQNAQRRQRLSFLPDEVRPILIDLVERLVAARR